MIPRRSTHLLLSPVNFSPSQENLRILGAFNPGVVEYGDAIVLLVRVAETAREKRDGYFASPRLNEVNSSERYAIDWFAHEQFDDQRKPLLPSGLRRLSSISHLEIVRCDTETNAILSVQKHDELFPREDFESYGIEDARICPIGENYYITYTAVSPNGIAAAAMVTSDFRSFRRMGIIFPPENKNFVLWRQNSDQFFALHRPTSLTPISRSGVWISRSQDGRLWGAHRFLFGPTDNAWESGKIGISTPPVATDDGLLLLYHGVEYTSSSNLIGAYRIGGILLDPKDPLKILGRTKTPLIEAEADFEIAGFAPNVVFATGAVLDAHNQELNVWYGAADNSTGLINLSYEAVIRSILSH